MWALEPVMWIRNNFFRIRIQILLKVSYPTVSGSTTLSGTSEESTGVTIWGLGGDRGVNDQTPWALAHQNEI